MFMVLGRIFSRSAYMEANESVTNAEKINRSLAFTANPKLLIGVLFVEKSLEEKKGEDALLALEKLQQDTAREKEIHLLFVPVSGVTRHSNQKYL